MLTTLTLSASSPHEQGRAHGRAASASIARNVETTFRRLERSGMSRAAAQGEGCRWAERCRTLAPSYFEELEGICAGSGQDRPAVYALNFRFEIGQPLAARRLGDRGSAAATCCAPACTVFCSTGPAPGPGIAFAGQTLDGLESVQDHLLLIRRPVGPGRTTLALHEAGVAGPSVGLSSEGFALNYAGLILGTCATPIPSLPLRARFRACLDAADFRAAVEAVSEAPTPCASAVVVSSREEGAVLVEHLGPDVAVRPARRPTDTRSNHPLLAAGAGSLFERALPDSLFRAARLQRLLGARGLPSLAEIKDALGDHFSAPASICLHPDPSSPPERRSATLCAVIADLTKGLLHVSDGQPCQGRWTCHPVSG